MADSMSVSGITAFFVTALAVATGLLIYGFASKALSGNPSQTSAAGY